MFFPVFAFFTLLLSVSIATEPPRMLEAAGAGRFIETHQFVPMQWTGSVVPGGDNHTFIGTVQEIVAQIQRINPNYSVPETTEQATTLDEIAAASNVSPARRQYHHTICEAPDTGYCPDLTKALDGIHYLMGVGGDCGLEAGPATCARISCSWNCGITWCNDNDHYASWKCSELAPSALAVVEQCTFGVPVWGQTFDEQNFNVIVGYSPC